MPGEIVLSVKMPITRDKTERPHGALLQLDTEFRYVLYRIGGRLGVRDASYGGVTVGIPPLVYWNSNRRPLSGHGTMSGRQFDWGGRLRKSNGGAQRLTQRGRKPRIECKRRSQPNCDTDGWNSNESWS